MSQIDVELQVYLEQNKGASMRHTIIPGLTSAMVEYLVERYPGETLTTTDRLAYFRAGCETTPSCLVCGEHTPRAGGRIRTFCSVKCATIHRRNTGGMDRMVEKARKTNMERYGTTCGGQTSAAREKRRQTNLEKYGVEHAIQSDQVREATKKTNMKRYGVANATQTPEVQEKRRRTNLERLGVEHPSQSPEVRAKIVATCLERYGVENPTQCQDVQERARQTLAENYGVENPMSSPEIRSRAKQTLIKKHGVEHPMDSLELRERVKQTNLSRRNVEYPTQSVDVREKVKQTLMTNYGVENPMDSPELREKMRQTNLGKYGTTSPSQAHILNYDQYVDDDAFTELYTTLSMVDLRKHFNLRSVAIYRRARPLGLTTPSSSKAERDIAALVESTGHEIISNSRKVIPPLELDIYIPELKLAIEYCGLYWHSEVSGSKDKSYHVDKLLACEAQGIRLITVFSDEWETKQDIVRSRLLNLLGQSKTIFARKCVIKELDTSTARTFLTDNHIQGPGSSRVKLGLYHDDVLVSVMTFSSSNYARKQTGWEIDRFCNLTDVTVVGGASRLFKYFVRHHPDVHEVVSFADRRWSDGGLYKTLGMTETSLGQPNYWYTNDYETRVSRVKFQKARIPDVDVNLTEWQNMQTRDYDRIWDCGSRKYLWTRPRSQPS